MSSAAGNVIIFIKVPGDVYMLCAGSNFKGKAEPSNIINTVTSFMEQQADVLAAYLFGSLARGRGKQDSDVDIAVLFSPSMEDKFTRFNRRLEMEIALEENLKRPVQVVDLGTASPGLQHQVRKYGLLLVDKDRPYRIAFEVRSRRRYLDMQWYDRRRLDIRLKKLGDEKW
ncbi:DNA polymerase beta domain protein region [Desulfofundulus kuznetsovii DSM 6115]|uniref:DNA polymerase beta domain protein region n=2 Tax=Desulfofundulus kuznetsovii TaxID=58135 RepID=A0AAU8PBC6_DESK7|nr:DNA polymerase beta domain protein region [Desulfofundulus kuznetsovii DSM 6115]